MSDELINFIKINNYLFQKQTIYKNRKKNQNKKIIILVSCTLKLFLMRNF